MKQKDLLKEVQRTAFDNHNGIFRPRVEGDQRTRFPVCQTCRREVEAVELKDWNHRGVTLWARCHGKEDHYEITFPTWRIEGWDMDDPQVQADIRAATNAFRPFDPTLPSK